MRIAMLLVFVAAGCSASGGGTDVGPESVRVVVAQAMPPLDGAGMEVTLVEVQYGPGGSSTPHRHTCPVIGYVIEGALKTQVRGGPVQVFRAGESFYEAPNGVHEVSANASDREPVRFLATFVCDHNRPSTVGAPAASGAAP